MIAHFPRLLNSYKHICKKPRIAAFQFQLSRFPFLLTDIWGDDWWYETAFSVQKLLLYQSDKGRWLRACPSCPFQSVSVSEKAVCCTSQNEIADKCKMRPSAKRGRAHRKQQLLTYDVCVHPHSRNIPVAGIGFFWSQWIRRDIKN